MVVDDRVRSSMALYDRAGRLIPGRTQLVSRRASMFAEGVSPVYAQRAKGSRFIDVDGNEYIDWVNCVSAVILGHADPVVDGAVKEQIDRGSLYSVNNPAEIELAELLVDTIPSAEMVRYCKGGGEACTIAVKIARGTTGRDKILFSGYHGWHDWYQSVNYLADPDTGEFPIAGIEPIGVPKVLAGTALPFTYGKLESLEGLFAENRGEVAAVIMEPLRSDIPPEGYLEGVKEIAEANDALLIFDEVSCGWRTRIGGIQEYAGVTPDMSVFAKSMSNGYPMGVVVGSRDAMELAGRMFISSSYWSDNVGLAASLATINELKRLDSPARFEVLGEKNAGRHPRRGRLGRRSRVGLRLALQMRLELRPARRGDALQDQHPFHPGDGSQRYPYDHVVDADVGPYRRGHSPNRRRGRGCVQGDRAGAGGRARRTLGGGSEARAVPPVCQVGVTDLFRIVPALSHRPAGIRGQLDPYLFFSGLRRERVSLTNQRLCLADGQSLGGLVPPEALYVSEHLDYLFVAEQVAKRRHRALEAGIAGDFQRLPALAYDPVQEAIRVVPCVPVAIERRRRQCAIGVLNAPVRVTLAGGSVAGGAI